MIKNLTVIGGDLRIVNLLDLLSKDGYSIKIFGLEKIQDISNKRNILFANNLQEATSFSDVIISSIPLSKDKKHITAPYSDKKIEINEILKDIKNKFFISGNIDETIYEIAREKNIKVIDILKREELAILNAISTAEGAIKIAIEETKKTLHGSNILITGFGRIGKILAKMLDGIGANIYCEARKESDLAWIKAYGYKQIHINHLNDNLNKFDIIMNTIPNIIFDEERLKKIKKDCLIIDLASVPGGIDKKSAIENEIKTIWALALPGKVAPITSAEYIKETIYNIFNEIKL